MRNRDNIRQDAKPFADSVIAKVDSGGGYKADYVSWPHYAQRLLLDHGAHRYSVTGVYPGKIEQKTAKSGKEFLEQTWAVSVRVQFSDDEFYDGVGEGDTPTSAESNAYKRACAHAGIGLHLYGDYWLHRVLSAQEAPEAPESSNEG